MSQMKVLTVLATVLAAGAAYAEQQTVQPGQQRPAPAWNSPQAVHDLSLAVERADADLYKAIDTAIGQVKGKAIGAAFTLHDPYTGQGQNLVAHVYVVADNQLKDVIVDPKADKVLDVETRHMVNDPWAYREGGMGMGGSIGASEGAAAGKHGAQGETLRERAGIPADVSMLRLDTARNIAKYADRDSVTLRKAYDFADGQAENDRIVGVFLALPNQTNLEAGVTSGLHEKVFAKVFALVDDQVKVMTIDLKNDKVLGTDTRAIFIGPWEGRGGSSGMGGSTGQPREGSSRNMGLEGPNFPTGSSEGTDAGSLGGE
jgi:hypothetical protein